MCSLAFQGTFVRRFRIKIAKTKMTARWQQSFCIFCVSLLPSSGHLYFYSSDMIALFLCPFFGHLQLHKKLWFLDKQHGHFALIFPLALLCYTRIKFFYPTISLHARESLTNYMPMKNQELKLSNQSNSSTDLFP